MEHIPNYNCGKFVSNGQEHLLSDPDGLPCASICFASPSEVRASKRELLTIQARLSAFPVEAVVDFLERLPEQLVLQYNIGLISRLSGSSRSSIAHSLERRVSYCKRIREHLAVLRDDARRTRNGELQQTVKEIKLPGGPVIAVLPKNSDEEAFYVIVQALLSRCVCLVRCPSSGFSSLPAIYLAKAMIEVARTSNKFEDHVIASAFCVLNTERGEDYNSFIRNLFIPDAAWVLFGTSDKVSAFQAEIRKTGPARRILEFGSGFGIAIVSASADIEKAATEIADGITYNNGNECIGTKVVFVEQPILQAFFGRLQQLCGAFDRNGPWGKMTQAHFDSIRQLTDPHAPDGDADKSKCTVECIRLCDASDSTSFIVPAPLASVFGYDSKESLTQQIHARLQESEIQRPLSLSIFCAESEVIPDALVSALRPYVVKKNRGTHRMNMTSPHQGVVLWKEFVQTVTCEE